MKIVADFHIHSKYSRATSPQMDLDSLDKWARVKGIDVLGTGDFTHPQWFKGLKEKLEMAEPGLFKLKKSDSKIRFILTVEISGIYSKNNKVRKIHNLIFSPSFEIAEKINTQLGLIGNLKSDGRPILGLDSKELAKIVFSISKDCVLIPCHIWTPWFSLFGSKSGFDSIEECFEEYSCYIFAGETGLSSDPAMNWRISALDKITLISNSDAHSPAKIGREANIFDLDFLSYSNIVEAIKSKNPKKFLYTIEFYPQEGKYHYDGHRNCGVNFSPKESKKCGNICPVCGKGLTIGVLNRIEKLSDRPEGFKPQNAIPFKSLIPLQEIIAESLGIGVGTKKTTKEYENLIKNFGNEFNVLLETSLKDLEKVSRPEIAEGVLRSREGKIYIEPGYDGVYGKIKIFSKEEQKKLSQQGNLF
ncbi:MAG: endonuclease Q family protein [Candidatus Nealsonbacteria bacterium]|nr:endonuclease Q family protein [Candidatus Nealsonbacteria bacterium]